MLESTSDSRGHRGVGGGSYVGGGGGARSIGDSGGGVGVSAGESSLDVNVDNNSGGGGGGDGGSGGGRGWRSTVSVDNRSGVTGEGGGVGSRNLETDNSSSRNNNGVRIGGAAEAAAQESSSNREGQGAAASSGGDNVDHDDDDNGRSEGVGNITTLGGLLSVLGSDRIRVSRSSGIGGAAGGIAAAAPSSDPFSSLLRSYGSSSSNVNSSNNNSNINKNSNSNHGLGNQAIDPETRSAAQAAVAAIRVASRYTSLVPAQALAVQGLAALESLPTLRQLRAVTRPRVGGRAWAEMAGAPALAGVPQRRQRRNGLGQDTGEDRDDEAGVSRRGDGRKNNSEERGSLLPRIDSDHNRSDDNRSDNISSSGGGGNGAEEEPCIESVTRRAAVGERNVGESSAWTKTA